MRMCEIITQNENNPCVLGVKREAKTQVETKIEEKLDRDSKHRFKNDALCGSLDPMAQKGTLTRTCQEVLGPKTNKHKE